MRFRVDRLIAGKSMLSKRQSGFTMIELMVTLLVLVILAAIAAPSFNELIEKSRLRGATDDLVNVLNTARANAVKLQRDVNVSVSGTAWCAGAISAPNPGNVGDPIPSATPCDCNASPATCQVGGQPALVSSTNYSGVTISNVSAGINYVDSTSGVIFNSKLGALSLSALPANPLLTVTSKSGRYSTQISVAPLGQVTVCVPPAKSFVAGYPSC